MNFTSYGQTDKGRVREENEDCYLIHNESGMFAVADGLGGLPRGSLASRIAINELEKQIPEIETGKVSLKNAIEAVNLKVHKEGREIGSDLGIGTTLTIAYLRGTRLYLAHVGDCSVFLLRNGDLKKLTIDHTMEEEIRSRLKPGEEARVPEYFAHTLTRCVGQQPSISIDFHDSEMKTGDRIFVLSDGITKVINQQDLHDLVARDTTPKMTIQRLIEEANNRGGPDNSTGIAVFA